MTYTLTTTFVCVSGVQSRLQKLETGSTLDWSTAEALALGTLLCQGKQTSLRYLFTYEQFSPQLMSAQVQRNFSFFIIFYSILCSIL